MDSNCRVCCDVAADPDRRPKRRGLHMLGCGKQYFGAPYTYKTDEAHLKCCVFLQLGRTPVLIDTASSLASSEEPPAGPFFTAAGKPASGLTADEFVNVVDRYLQQCTERPQYIVLDRDLSLIHI